MPIAARPSPAPLRPPACTRACVRARNCRRRRAISISPIPWANWACSIASRRSCSWADLWSNMAGKNRSRRANSAPPSFPAPLSFNLTDVYEALESAGGARRADSQETLVKQLGQLLADPKARDASLAASERVVEQLGRALERTVSALEPHIL